MNFLKFFEAEFLPYSIKSQTILNIDILIFNVRSQYEIFYDYWVGKIYLS